MVIKFKFYPIALLSGIAVGAVFCMAVFQPKPKPTAPKEVKLEHVYHLPCRFEAESYEPAEFHDGMKFPMSCGCSEIKGTCGRSTVIEYTLPDSYFKEEN